MKVLITAVLIISMFACQSNQAQPLQKDENSVNTSAVNQIETISQNEPLQQGVHKVIVEEVIQTSNYTYLRVNEDGAENWLAVPKMEATVGETYYHAEGMKMVDFESKELGRKFDVVYFLSAVSATAPGQDDGNTIQDSHGSTQTDIDENINIEVADGGITIAQLLANKADYAEKTVKIRAQVVKFSEQIMNTNWIHLQDGTSSEGKFDLTVTSNATVKVGDVLTLEGKVAIDKDFGYGYFYDVLMEDAVVK